MRDSGALEGFGGLGWLLLGMGIISWPLLRPPLALTEPATPRPSSQISPGLCPSGLAYEPYCYDDTRDTVGVGTDLVAQHYGIRVASLDAGLACPGTGGLRAMIAMLPDPVESRMGNSTDAVLYAISRAHERAGYVLDRYWLPWPAVAGSDSAGRRPRGQPGAVLYRRTSQSPADPRNTDPGTLSLVYLVGETPTQGLDRPALRRGMADLLRLRRSCPTQTLSILGPYFSSGAPGLAAELDRLRGGIFLQVDLVSGSATANSTGRLARVIHLPGSSHRKISFRATVHSDSAYTLALARLVDQAHLRIDPRQIANLTEQATAYGQSILQSSPDATGASDSLHRPLEISFPMNIATIRDAYEAAEQRGAQQADPAKLGPRVSLTDGRSATARDGIPLFSGVTVATQEIFLNQIGSMLAERRILLTGLHATDPRDKLFLARELHRRLPNVQFYTYESNSLFLRPDYENALKGMLVLSTYPLIPDPRRAQGPELLPSDPATGVYNATLVQLGESNLVSYATSLLEGHDVRDVPPVWVTVVGAGSIQPLRIVPDSIDRDRFPPVGAPGAALPRERDRPANRIVLLALLFALGWQAALKVRRLRTAPSRSSVSLWTAMGGVRDWMQKGGTREPCDSLKDWFAAERGQFGGYALLTLMVMLAPLCIIFGAAPPGVASTLFGNRWVLGAIVAVPLLAGLLLLFLSIGRMPRDLFPKLMSGAPFRGIPELGSRFLVDVAAAWFLFVALLFSVSTLRLSERDGIGILFWSRARAMDARLSPLLVVLLVGLTTAFWAWWHRRRVKLLEDTTQFECALVLTATTPGAASSPWTQIRQVAEEFRWHLALLTPSPPAIVVLLLGILAAWGLWPQTGHILERGLIEFSPTRWTDASRQFAFSFRWILWFGLVTGLVLTIISVERLLALWRLLRQTLRAVGNLPLEASFDRLSSQARRLTQLVRLGDGPDWQAIQEERWRQLVNLTELPPGANETPAEAARRTALAATLKNTSGPGRTTELIGHLTPYWASQPTAPVAAELDSAMKEFKELRRDGDKAGLPVSHAIRNSTPDRLALWTRAAEEYVASEIIEYIDWALNALRHIAAFLAAAMVCTSLLIFAYPFAYERFVQLYFFLLFVVTIGALGWMSVGINKNEVISRITRTTPGQLTWDRSLLTNLALLVGVPILSYVGTAVPELHHLLLGWLQPLSGLLTR